MKNSPSFVPTGFTGVHVLTFILTQDCWVCHVLIVKGEGVFCQFLKGVLRRDIYGSLS